MQSNSPFCHYILNMPCLIVCLTILSESMIKFCIVISTYYGREQNYILYQNDIQKFLKNMTYDKNVKYGCKHGLYIWYKCQNVMWPSILSPNGSCIEWEALQILLCIIIKYLNPQIRNKYSCCYLICHHYSLYHHCSIFLPLN